MLQHTRKLHIARACGRSGRCRIAQWAAEAAAGGGSWCRYRRPCQQQHQQLQRQQRRWQRLPARSQVNRHQPPELHAQLQGGGSAKGCGSWWQRQELQHQQQQRQQQQ